MIVSALLTSVGINFGLCVLFFTLYSVLRKQPSNYDVYVPRLLVNGESHRRSHFNLERLIPTPGWVRRAWRHSEEELLASSGLDAVVFMRIIIFSLRVFCVAGIIGVFVLLPVNFTGDSLQGVDFANLTNDSLDVFSISNIENGSKRLWIHFCAVYIVSIFVCYLLYNEYRYISSKRVDYFLSSQPQPHQFSILVRSIPVSVGTSISDSVQRFFTEYHPSTYLSHTVIRRTSKIRNLISDTQKLYKRLILLRTEPTRPKYERYGFCGLFRRRVDLVDQYEKKLEDLEDNLRLEQSVVSLAGEEVRAAFVSFKSRFSAATAFHMQQSNDPTHWVTELAPEPLDVYWPFFSTTFMERWLSKLMVLLTCIVLTVLFLIPVLFVQGLTNLDQLELWFPFLTSIASVKVISQVITGYLPSLILLLFLKVVPPIMWYLSSIQGHISNSQIERSACDKVLWFTIWNVFFGNVLSGSVLTQISILLEPKNIPGKLALTVPAQASFFIAYVVTSGWTSVSTELFRIIPFFGSLITKPCKSPDDEFEVPPFPYYRDIPRLLFFGLLGITYFFLAPLILPFLLIYFCLTYIIYRNQFINVYEPKYETAGKLWPLVHTSMIFSLILMHAIAIGIFTLKKLPEATTFIVPLPILTLLFNEYCRKRFLPNFTAYSVECLVKKDREDHDDDAMAEFYEKMATAYQDPALLPVQFSVNHDSHSAPLLSSPDG